MPECPKVDDWPSCLAAAVAKPKPKPRPKAPKRPLPAVCERKCGGSGALIALFQARGHLYQMGESNLLEKLHDGIKGKYLCFFEKSWVNVFFVPSTR